MKITGVSRTLIDLLLEIGHERHPYEFAGVLREEEGVIKELFLLPGTVSGEDSAQVLLDMMPLDLHTAGSAHSHPSGGLRPSDADLSFFPRVGRYHFIVGYPYADGDWRCYHSDGSPAPLEVVS
ncbi:MAG: Mov34/MPN/PAD-1 family protein [Methanoregulaceae archaeon]|nr:Mov34/MPN/PAD-1 family protein [Methanoregulaceae archaeon]